TILVSVAIPQILTTRKQLERLVLVLLFSATLVGIFGLFQFIGDIAGLPTTITGLRDLYTKEIFGFPRIQSTALEPLYFANYLLIPLGVLFAFLLARKGSIPRWITFLLFALLTANLVLTVSRGAYLGFAGLVLCIILLALRDFFRLRTLLPLGIGAVLVAIAVLRALSLNDATGLNIETFTSHIQNVFYGASYTERIETIETAKQAFWTSPMVGIGPGSFGPFTAPSPVEQPQDGWRIVNNEPLELLAETGLLGLLAIGIAFFILIARSIKALWRCNADDPLRYVLLGLLGALIGVIIQYQTFSILYIMHIWVFVGLLVAVQNLVFLGERQ
ncbi:MAG: O-antigen ligase family protein, partial [bacterium]